MEKLSATLLLTVAVVLLSVQANTPFGNFLTKVVSVETPIFEPAEAPTTYDEVEEYPIEADTIPDGVQDAHFHISTNDEQVEVRVKDGKITFLEVDGEVIPPSRYSEYEEQVQEILANMPESPEAPEFPEFPEMPAPPSFEGYPAPAAPPAPPAPGTRKITTQKDRNGTTFLIETEDGGEPVEIVVKDGKKGTIIVNGQEINGLKKGDKTIIMQDVPQTFTWNGEWFLRPGEYNPQSPALSAERFSFDFPAMSLDCNELNREALAELHALRNDNFPAEFQKEWEIAAQSLAEADSWRATNEEQLAELEQRMAELREQQQELLERQREEIERAMEQTREAQREAMRKLEQERKAA
ncbi:MAG: hypothetical protein MUC59_16790, partial [Saprospiraceae bacterium]|nr:hypothetical protein [Saprospiraceae bacterium]